MKLDGVIHRVAAPGIGVWMLGTVKPVSLAAATIGDAALNKVPNVGKVTCAVHGEIGDWDGL